MVRVPALRVTCPTKSSKILWEWTHAADLNSLRCGVVVVRFYIRSRGGCGNGRRRLPKLPNLDHTFRQASKESECEGCVAGRASLPLAVWALPSLWSSRIGQHHDAWAAIWGISEMIVGSTWKERYPQPQLLSTWPEAGYACHGVSSIIPPYFYLPNVTRSRSLSYQWLAACQVTWHRLANQSAASWVSRPIGAHQAKCQVHCCNATKLGELP